MNFKRKEDKMRTIKFRGKTELTGEWVYGFFSMGGSVRFEYQNQVERIVPRYLIDDGLLHDVIPETVGQFTGLHDKNGKEIYDGDIIKEDNLIHKILWINEASAFCRCDLKYMDIRYRISRDAMSYIEVIGNIHDNPELLKGCEK